MHQNSIQGKGTHASDPAQNQTNGQNDPLTGTNQPVEVDPRTGNTLRGGCHLIQVPLYVLARANEQGTVRLVLLALADYRNELYAELLDAMAPDKADFVTAGARLSDIEDVDALTLDIEMRLCTLAEGLGFEKEATQTGLSVEQLKDTDEGRAANKIKKILGRPLQ